MPTGTNRSRLLDEVQGELRAGDAQLAMDRLFAGLRELRADLDRAEWLAFADDHVPQHPVCALVHEDPMVRRSYEKPRGYAGDAVLLDYIYRIRRPDTSRLGSQINDYLTSSRPAALAVQTRRRVVARRLDELTNRPPGSRRVLSVACGHFREGHLSGAVTTGQLDEIVALDADAESLRVVDAEFAAKNVRTVERSVRDLLGRNELGAFDFVYSAGLYDYLEDRFAKRLTRRLFDMLRPGGKLLVCNFVPQIFDAAYMESFMGWRLIYRDEDELPSVAAECPADAIASRRTWTDAHDAVAYLELVRT